MERLLNVCGMHKYYLRLIIIFIIRVNGKLLPEEFDEMSSETLQTLREATRGPRGPVSLVLPSAPSMTTHFAHANVTKVQLRTC